MTAFLYFVAGLAIGSTIGLFHSFAFGYSKGYVDGHIKATQEENSDLQEE